MLKKRATQTRRYGAPIGGNGSHGRSARIFSGLGALAVNLFLGLLMLGCLAPGPDEDGGGATSGVGLYVFNTATNQVLVWRDLGAFYDDPGTPAASSTLTSGLFPSVSPLAWNGMAFDSIRNQLYLVSESGRVVRVSRARAQTGAIPSADILSFTLNNPSPFTNSRFEQAAVDTSSNTLYVAENGDNGTRIWAVANASGRTQGESVPLSAVQVASAGSGDSGGYGVAAAQGNIYGSFRDGDPVGINNLTGPRLRRGSGSSFPAQTQVLVGPDTLLGPFSPLALDTGNGILYAGIHLSTAGVSGGSPVAAFRVSRFTGSPGGAPDARLGDSATLNTLRFLAHPGTRDWLVGGPDTGGTLWIWRQPSAGSQQFRTKALGATTVRAVALDGSS